MPRLCSSLLLSFAVLSSAAAPGLAAPFTFSGPVLAPCAEGQCMDLNWDWDTSEDHLSTTVDQAVVDLPRPDPSQWMFTSGSIHVSPGAAGVIWYFNADDFREHEFAGNTGLRLEVIGANTSVLARTLAGITAICWAVQDSESTRVCRNGNGFGGSNYPIVDESAVLGQLTFRYDHDPDYYKQPLSEEYWIAWGGSIHLVYSAIPEPSTGLLVIAGLLGFGVRRRADD